MKIGLLSSHRGQKQLEKQHKAIVDHLKKRGHEVVHSMDTSIDHLMNLTYIEREKIFVKYYKELEECDMVIAECTLQSTQVGFGVSYIRSKGKPTVILTHVDKIEGL